MTNDADVTVVVRSANHSRGTGLRTEPSVVAAGGCPARLSFLRISDKTCGTEVTIPSLNITRAPALNEPVDIDFTPAKREIAVGQA